MPKVTTIAFECECCIRIVPFKRVCFNKYPAYISGGEAAVLMELEIKQEEIEVRKG